MEDDEGMKRNIFLDASVLLSFIRNDWKTRALLSNLATSRFRYYVSPVVTQEVLRQRSPRTSRTDGPRLRTNRILSKVTILNLRQGPWEIVSPQLEKLKVKLHPNDYVNLLSALTTCDSFVTLDAGLLSIRRIDHMRILEPVELLREGNSQ